MRSLVRALLLPLHGPLPAPVLSVLADYRLLVNEIVREALTTGRTSLGSMDRFARDRALHHALTGDHAVAAAAIGLSLAKAHRRRLRKGEPSSVPWVRRPFLRTPTKTFHFDPVTGKVRLSLRRGEWASFQVHVSPYHRERLSVPGIRIKQLHLTPAGAILILERPAPEPFVPQALVALDTNEGSLDGVVVGTDGTAPARIRFAEVPTIQHRYFVRRRRLAKKKATDRRVGRRLLAREGRRERNRVKSRLHNLTRRLVDLAARHRAALVLEDLSGMRTLRRRRRPRSSSSVKGGSGLLGGSPRARWRFRPSSSKFRRRMSSWPRAELHRQLAYKAAERGVSLYLANPFRSSVTCPRCGEYQIPQGRVRPKFTCASCGWTLDRQINAGVNLAKTVLRDYGRTELGGLRLDLDALSKEAMRPRYPFAKSKGHGLSVRRGRDHGIPPPKGEIPIKSQSRLRA